MLTAIYLASSGLTLYLGRLQVICRMDTSVSNDDPSSSTADNESRSVARSRPAFVSPR